MKRELTGRIIDSPHELYIQKVLLPQFEFELKHYLKHYLAIEKTLLKSYEHQKILSLKEVNSLKKAISSVKEHEMHATSSHNLTDIALTIEQAIEEGVGYEIPSWHLDRSRNDYQACAQLMYGREKWIELIQKMLTLNYTVMKKMSEYPSTLMPGYTHHQSAQIISVSFYFTSISKHLLYSSQKMIGTLQKINMRSPLGSGALSGQELAWDCKYLADSLGFDSFIGHSLDGVASRDWLLEIGADLTFFGNNMSRYLTDFINWSSSEYQFINFPDAISGISSSMPQKKNYPILERARGKTGHLISYYTDFLIGQRSTPYSNLVEVSKEAGKNMSSLMENADDLLDLLILIFESIEFQPEKMRERCDSDYFGGFSLANSLTLKNGIPYRDAQVIAGKFITYCLEKELKPKDVSIKDLNFICNNHGYKNQMTEENLREFFNSEKEIERKVTSGSTSTKSVETLIEVNNKNHEVLQNKLDEIVDTISNALISLDQWTCQEEPAYEI